jgi:hypothetical protein
MGLEISLSVVEENITSSTSHEFRGTSPQPGVCFFIIVIIQMWEMVKTRCYALIDDCMGNALLILPHHCWLPSHIGEGNNK